MQRAPKKASVLAIDRGTETTYAWVGEFVAIMAQAVPGTGRYHYRLDRQPTSSLLKKESFPVLRTESLPDHQHGNWYQ